MSQTKICEFCNGEWIYPKAFEPYHFCTDGGVAMRKAYGRALDVDCGTYIHVTKPQFKDMVDSPAHYGGADSEHEHWKCAQAWGLVDTPLIGAWLYNASKYICRAGKKSGAPPIEDLKKAIWYINRAIKRLEEEK